MDFLKTSAHTSNLLKYLISLKVPDKVTLENWVLINTYKYLFVSISINIYLKPVNVG